MFFFLFSSLLLLPILPPSPYLLLAVDALEREVRARARGRGRLGRRESGGGRCEQQQGEEGESSGGERRRSLLQQCRHGLRFRDRGREFVPLPTVFFSFLCAAADMCLFGWTSCGLREERDTAMSVAEAGEEENGFASRASEKPNAACGLSFARALSWLERTLHWRSLTP